MNERLFRTDGIRGVANVYPMTAEIVLKVGRAAGYVFQKEDGLHTILIGKDTRQSGYLFENALTAGLCSVGVNVLLVGPLPTPGVSYIMYHAQPARRRRHHDFRIPQPLPRQRGQVFRPRWL